MTLLYLVRHGETDWNAARRIQGRTDIPLNEIGRDQARRTGALLARREFDAVISSPLSRAFETGRLIAAELGLPEPTTDGELVERNYGEAEGLASDEIDRRYPGSTRVPGRETREQVAARVVPALLRIAEAHRGGRLVIVAHGGVIRVVLNSVTPTDRFAGVPITNGSIHSFRVDDGALRLIDFDDPIEPASIEPGADDFDAQNALAGRD